MFNIKNSKIHQLSTSKTELDVFKRLELVHLAWMAAIAIDLFPDGNKHMNQLLAAKLTRRINKRPKKLYIRSVYLRCFDNTMKCAGWPLSWKSGRLEKSHGKCKRIKIVRENTENREFQEKKRVKSGKIQGI